MLADLIYRFRALFRRDAVERELDDELRFHIEQQAARHVQRGMSEAEALRRARVDLSGPEQVKEACRDARGTRWLEDFLHDVRFGSRMLRKDRGYTLAAVAALSVGIGANAVLFTVFNGVVLKPLPVPEPGGLVSIYRTSASAQVGLFTFAAYAAFRDRATVFSSLTVEEPTHLRLITPGAAASPSDAAMGLWISSNYLSTFGVRPVVGRGLTAEDERLTAPPFPALISENYWERRFARDASILGQTVLVSGVPTQIVGVTPANFMGTRPDVPDFWPIISAAGNPARRADDHATICCALTGRLKPGVTPAQAQAQLAAIAAAERRMAPGAEPWTVRVEPAGRFGTARRPFRTMYLLLQAAMALVLLIACSNVAGLLLSRAAARRKEIAVRLAIGAGRGRLIRQLLTEGLVIASTAGACSLLLAWQVLAYVLRLVARASSEGGTIVLNVAPDLRVLAYLAGVSAIAGISFALAPALQATGADVVAAIKEEAGFGGAGHKGRLRGWMLAAQVGVCLALLIGAGMLAASSVRMMTVNPGFDSRNVLLVSLGSPGELEYSPTRELELRDILRRQLEALPGVVSIASPSFVPLGNNLRFTTIDDSQSRVPYSYVSGDYFRTLNLGLARGREFSAGEVATGAPVAIVSEGLARRLWPAEDPLGKHIRVGSRAATRVSGEISPSLGSSEVIGIAHDVSNIAPTERDPAFLYLPKPPRDWDFSILVRYRGNRAAVSAAVLAEIRNAENRLPVSVETFENAIANGEMAVAVRIAAMIFAGIGLIGFALASVGVYSMAGYTASRQTRDVGIRMALGAGTWDVLRFLLADTMRWISIGVGAGAVLGMAISRVLSGMMQGLKLLDPLVLIGVCAITAGIAVLAAMAPARKAARTDPATTLRTS